MSITDKYAQLGKDETVAGLKAEIERLRLRIKDLEINSPAQAALDEIERLTAALRAIAPIEDEARGIARRALEDK